MPGSGVQIRDLNPTTFPPVGLFWTSQISDDGVEAQPGAGNAVLRASNVPILDYGNIENALFGGGPPATPGLVSFRVRWSGVQQRINVSNTDPIYGGFGGEFVRNAAQMEWTATVGDFRFESDPLETSSSGFAEIGHERNGVFFR